LVALALWGSVCVCADLASGGTRQVSRLPAAARPPRMGAIIMPRWSPDGSKVAFVYDVGGDPEVYIVNADGTKLKDVSKHTGEDTNPVWSPDGKTLLFTSFRKGIYNICRTSSEGGKAECVVAKGDDLWPAWSPDGKTIAFCNYETGNPYVYFMTPDGKDRKRFFDKPACHPAFSADGKRLALSSEGDLLVFTLKTGKRKNITEALIEGNAVDDTYPVWAPRGDRIAFIGQFEAFSAEIYTISASGKRVRRLTDNLYEDFLPSWHPKGKGVAYAGLVPGRLPEIFVAQPDSPEKTRLTKNSVLEMSPQFSPDGKKIIYVVRRKAQDELYIMNADGTDQKPFLKEKLPSVEQMRQLRKYGAMYNNGAAGTVNQK